MKRILAAVVALACLATLFAFQYKAMQAPGTKERLYSIIHDTPANIFYPVFVVFTVLVLGPGLYIMINQRRWSRLATSGSIRSAKKVALSLWRAESHTIIDECPVVRFRHVSFNRWSFVLPVRFGHPDIERFRQLKDGDTIEFEPLSKCMECALEHELCGYLRIKSVS